MLKNFIAAGLNLPSSRKDWYAEQEALKELFKCGTGGVGVVHSMIDDPQFFTISDILIEKYVDMGGAEVGLDLLARLNTEIKFWESDGPAMSPDWWVFGINSDKPLPVHYRRTCSLLRGLRQLRFSDAVPSMIVLRDFLRALPQFKNLRGIDDLASLSDTCARELTASVNKN